MSHEVGFTGAEAFPSCRLLTMPSQQSPEAHVYVFGHSALFLFLICLLKTI